MRRRERAASNKLHHAGCHRAGEHRRARNADSSLCAKKHQPHLPAILPQSSSMILPAAIRQPRATSRAGCLRIPGRIICRRGCWSEMPVFERCMLMIEGDGSPEFAGLAWSAGFIPQCRHQEEPRNATGPNAPTAAGPGPLTTGGTALGHKGRFPAAFHKARRWCRNRRFRGPRKSPRSGPPRLATVRACPGP